MSVATPGGPARDALIGYACATAAVLIWASWISWTKAALAAGDAAALTPAEIGLLRFGAPAALLAPVWLRGGLLASLKPPELSWPALAAMLCWGAPFILFAGYGLRANSVAAMAAITPGAMPLFAAWFGFLVFREAFTGVQRIGLGLIAVALCLTAPGLIRSGPQAIWGGAGLLAAAACWACFALGFRASGLSATRAAGLVGAWSCLALAAIVAIQGGGLGDLSAAQLLWQLLLQGLLTGVLSVICFGIAIERLGAARAAPMTAVVPPLAALIGIALLGEPLTALEWAAVFSAGLGVALTSLRRPRRASSQRG